MQVLNAHTGLAPSSTAPVYQTQSPPSSWQMPQEPQTADELAVPQLPDLSRVAAPLQQVNLLSEAYNQMCTSAIARPVAC